MALRDPVAVYNAANNVEAHLICSLLNDAGIEAYLTEDVSPVGMCLFGLVSEIHKPQVWADRSDVERIKPLLDDYECQQAERQTADAKKTIAGEATVAATCEECGKQSVFPAAQEGSVQDCPHCGAYMDVEDTTDSEEWWREGEPDENTEGEL